MLHKFFTLPVSTKPLLLGVRKSGRVMRLTLYGAKKMNMISTGAFLPEVDASNKQETMAEKFARVWEKKNSKVARAGGVSLMALSLAACGSSSDDTPVVSTGGGAGSGGDDEGPSVPAVDAPKSISLSTASDNETGGSGADTFSASVSATAAEHTLSNTDIIDGGDGADTLNVVANVLAANIGVASAGLTSIETINIKAIDGDGVVGVHAATFDASLATGVTAVNATGNSNVTVTGLAAGASVGLVGNASIVNGILSYAYATATSAQTINIDGGTLNTGVANITATASTGVTTATINSTGAANKVDTIKLDSAGGGTVTSLTVNADTDLTATLTAADFAATATIDINGAGAVDLGSAANAKTIDAGGNSGGVTIAAGTNTTSLVGSTGNDVITSAAVATTAAISGGDGRDTLVINASTDVDTAAEAAQFTGFEVIKTGTSFDASLMPSIEAFNITATAGATSFTNLTPTQAADITISGAINGAGITFGLANALGTSDVLSVKIGDNSAAAGTAKDADSITANGFETFNLEEVHGSSAAAGADRTAVIADFTADKVTAINLTGASFDLENVATTKATTIDATALTGSGAATSIGLKAAGSLVATSTIKGSEFVDQLTIGAVGSTYLGNGGKDEFTSTTEAILAGSVLIDGGDGADTLTMSATGATSTNTTTIADTTFSKLASIETVSLSGAYAGSLAWTLGGFANALATSNGGVLKVTIANAATTVTADTIAIDASNLTGTNAIELTLTNTAGVGLANAGTDTYTGGAGNDKFIINYDVNNANDNSIVTIDGGAGNDTITFTMGSGTSAPGTITLTGGDGDDTITGSVEIDTITGGKGTDTMTGGTGNDIFVITTAAHSNAATAGAIDKITDFAGGAGDDLKVGVGATELNSETITATFSEADTIAELNALLNSASGTATTAKFDGTGADAALLNLADGRILVAVDIDASGTFTAADVVVEMTGLTGTLANTDIIV